MAKNKLELKELNNWLEYVTEQKVDGKPLDEKTKKYLEEVKEKRVTLEDATVIARFLTRYQTDPLYQFFDIISLVLQDKLGVTEEDFEKATNKLQKEIEKQEKEKDKVVSLEGKK